MHDSTENRGRNGRKETQNPAHNNKCHMAYKIEGLKIFENHFETIHGRNTAQLARGSLFSEKNELPQVGFGTTMYVDLVT